MFELAKQQVKLVKVSTPMENHGKDFKLACVLTIEALVKNAQLGQFGPGLRDALYTMAPQEDIDLATDPDVPSALRFPKMSAFEWDQAGAGYTLAVDYGLGGESDITLIDAKADSFVLTPMEGGTVAVKFNITVHPEAFDCGRLCEMQKQNIDITLTAPPPATVGELFGEQKKAA